jgi:ABC-type uncharacterized transport system permease subunit
MLNLVLNAVVIALYLGAGAGLWRMLYAGGAPRGTLRLAIYGLGFVAISLHAAILYAGMLAQGGLNLDLTNAFSLVAWAVATLFLVASLSQPIEMLGIFIFPTAALTMLLHWLWPGHYTPMPQASPLSITHVIISLLAYSLLTVAVVQGLMLGIQERRLHQKRAGRFLLALPPLQTMEHLMFQMIAIGFFLLTLTLISGIFFSEAFFGKPLAFTHHIVLSIFAWAVFAILLFGRWRFGWRGRIALRWALVGFGLLALAYFGSKFVLEILLGR